MLQKYTKLELFEDFETKHADHVLSRGGLNFDTHTDELYWYFSPHLDEIKNRPSAESIENELAYILKYIAPLITGYGYSLKLPVVTEYEYLRIPIEKDYFWDPWFKEVV